MCRIYWRYVVSLFLLFLFVAQLLEQIDFLNTPNYLMLKPTIVWAVLSALLTLVTLKQKNGVVYLLLGRRLKLNHHVWQKFNASLLHMFLILALLNYVVYALLSLSSWQLYKLYGQTSILLFWPMLSARYFMRKYAAAKH